MDDQRDETYAYKMGLDCGRNGANLTNCHFAIFSSKSNMKEWERGKADALNEKKGGKMNELTYFWRAAFKDFPPDMRVRQGIP